MSFPPSLNALYRTIIHGKGPNARAMPIKSSEYRLYEAEIYHWHEVNDRPRVMKPGVVGVTVHLYRPRAIGDADNYLKALLDVMTGIVYEDDSQIVEIHCYRHEGKDRPRVEVTVEEIPFASAPAPDSNQGRLL